MSDSPNEFEQLMGRIRSGCQEAIREMFERYSKHIRLIVRLRLKDRRLRSQFDSLDFTQDAWMSFFQVPADRYTFKTAEELVGFLSGIAYRKVVDAYRQRLQTDKHARHEVRRLRQQTDDGNDQEELPMRQPSPSQVAIAEERWELMLKDQPPRVRHALEMLRLGHTHQEVADCLGVPTKMVQRLLQDLARKLKLS